MGHPHRPGTNVALVVAGLVAVPEGRRPALPARLAAIIVQCAVAVAALTGPMALERRPRPALTCLLPGALFAVGYVSLLGLELAGFTLSFDRGAVTVYAWFATAAGLAGALTGWLTRRPAKGAASGCWALVIGTAGWSAGFLPLAYALRDTAERAHSPDWQDACFPTWRDHCARDGHTVCRSERMRV